MRTLPVVDGALKHQIYLTRNVPGAEAVLTVWTWKAGGSPIGGTRIAAEHDAFEAWFTASLRNAIDGNTYIDRIRTWDYGLDPAPRSERIVWPQIQGLLPNVAMPTTNTAWIVALRSQATGSVVRDRLNGRIFHPYVGTISGAIRPTSSEVQTAWSALRTARLNGAGSVGTWSFVSFFNAGVERVTPLVVPVNHVIVQRVGTQRRRVPRAGPYARGA